MFKVAHEEIQINLILPCIIEIQLEELETEMIKAGCLGDGDAGEGRCSGDNKVFYYKLIYTTCHVRLRTV